MSESLFSQSWYRVASVQPRLRSHVLIHQHMYRGENWYVVQDGFTGHHHRLSPEAYHLVGLMDGKRTLEQIWQSACEKLGDDMPTQDEVISLLSNLFRSDLLQTSVLPDFEELHQRRSKVERNRWLMNLRSPLSVRFPLFDPNNFLDFTLPLVRIFLGWPALIVWLLVVGSAVSLSMVYWTDLTGNFTDSLMTAQNIVVITLLYPLIKILHEFGHAYMVKKWGGEVHEMGVMLLVFMPIPYVEASSSLSFPDKWSRMAVGAAGILVELFIASLALLVWLSVEPGLVKAAAYNIMLIAGISTLLFNGNPLLRFDSYYVLSDFLEIPNLGQRSNRYIGYLAKRYLLNIPDAESSVATLSEGGWLLFYGLSSFCYRIFISFRIILFVAGKFFFIGIIIAAWAFYGMLIAPTIRLVGVISRDVQMKQRKGRLFLTVAVPLILLLLGVVAVPIPYFTRCEGVTWAPEDSRVYAGADGFITDVLVDSGSWVLPGTPLIQSDAPYLGAQVRLLNAKVSEFDARYQFSLQRDPTVSVLYKEELERLEAELKRARERQGALLLRAPTEGVFVLSRSGDFVGRFVRRGMPLAYVLNRANTRVRVLVPQDSIERVRTDTVEVDVRLSEDIGEVIPARVVREVPAASRILPSMVFSLEGGGEYALDNRQKKKAQVLDRLFQFDIELVKHATDRVEERVYVRFKHSPVPLAWRWYQAVRRLFLSRFGV